ncbi:MAG: sulfatase [Pirellulales bacterium]|nr:sulfatase [Pirellulales bacterium]
MTSCLRILSILVVLSGVLLMLDRASAAPERPNFVIIFADDLGYGDLGCFGHPTIATPRLDRMASEGQRWTSFYVAACVCTPSRAALLTGRLPVRNGMASNRRCVLFPDSLGGLPPSEITLAETLKDVGYATACIGKWHLGHHPQYLPTAQGFDSYFGLPYSNDMDRIATAPPGRISIRQPKVEYFNVPLMRDTKIIERPADQTTLTRRYTDEAIRFIRTNRDKPFFIYLAHSMPHVPLFRSKDFENHSLRGTFGDVVEEIDYNVGRIFDTLKELKLDERTMVVFTSDNGPWLVYNEDGGSAGPLRDGKGSTWEGGMREPTLFWWPGAIRPRVVQGIGSTMDLFTTCTKLAGGRVPDDRVIDGVDLSETLLGEKESPRQTMFYYRGPVLCAVRHGSYKAHFETKSYYNRKKPLKHDPPLLFDLDRDPGERFNMAKQHPEVIAEIKKIVAAHQEKLVMAPCELEKRPPREK